MKLKSIFIGNVDFSASALVKLLGMGVTIDAIVTKKDSHFNSDFYDLSKIAKKQKIPYKYVSNINNTEIVSWIKNIKPDIIYCFGFSQILEQEILNIPSLGVIGFHPAELPKNRGRHPIIWALVLGLPSTASTFFFMDSNADSGDIISQRPISIFENDNAQILYQKITKIALEQIEEFVPNLELGTYNRIKQNNKSSNFWRKRSIKDGEIDWRMSAKSIYNLVRGISKPYVGAHFQFRDEFIKVWEVKVVKNSNINIEPGKVIDTKNNRVIIKTGEDSICLLKIDPFPDIKLGSYL